MFSCSVGLQQQVPIICSPRKQYDSTLQLFCLPPKMSAGCGLGSWFRVFCLIGTYRGCMAPGQETSLACLGSKCTVLEKVHAKLLGYFDAPSDSAPGTLFPLPPSRYTLTVNACMLSKAVGQMLYKTQILQTHFSRLHSKIIRVFVVCGCAYSRLRLQHH